MFKKFAIAGAIALAAAFGVQAATITGAGATFPAPIYAKWAETYRASTGDSLNYQAIGSSGGVRQILARTVDFGASDNPMRPDELAAQGLVQFPTVIGGVVPVMNLPGINPGQVKLTGPVLAEIYQGTIRRWNDPRIAALNAGVPLPNLPITVVYRSDGSGTTFLFTTYLSMVSPRWSSAVGGNNSVSWPTGIGGRGNDGVAAFVRQTVGAIGYVEFAYAKQNSMDHAQMRNKAGRFVNPSAASFSAAAAGARWSAAPSFYLLLLDQAAPEAWPITGATFILMHKNQTDAAKATNALKFFDWAYGANGDTLATQLDYVPMPAAVKTLVRNTWTQQIRSGGRAVYTAR